MFFSCLKYTTNICRIPLARSGGRRGKKNIEARELPGEKGAKPATLFPICGSKIYLDTFRKFVIIGV
jgi:hypothetical protein